MIFSLFRRKKAVGLPADRKANPSGIPPLPPEEPERAPFKTTISQEREWAPRFKRIYSTRLDNGLTIKISWTSGYGRMAAGEITQPNGSWVLFDPERVAEKILDRNLVPAIEAFVAETKAMDDLFIRARPETFVDDKGVVWIRQGETEGAHGET